MRLSQIRSELLGEHARLRVLVEDARRCAACVSCDGAPVDTLARSLAQLADEVRRHNLHEEELLGRLLPHTDAWGVARGEIMNEEHIHEHEALYAALLGIPQTPYEFAGGGVQLLLEQLLEHMEREEKAFLGEEVLHDEAIVSDSFTG